MNLRITLVSDWWLPRRGGIEAQVTELARRLVTAGHEVRVVTSQPSAIVPAGVELVHLDIARVPRLDIAMSPRLPSRLRAAIAGADVVHAHLSVVSPVGWLGIRAARSLGLPVAATFHSVLRQKMWLLRGAALCGLGDARVAWSAVSALVAAQVRRGLRDSADVRVLPNGYDPDEWRCEGASRSSAAMVLVSSMRLQRKKRPEALLRAFAAATRDVPRPARLVIAGEGPARRRLETTARSLGLSEGDHRVEFRGWLNRAQLRSLYCESNAFVMASTRESFGIAALEASAAGLPVIARRSGNTEFLQDGQNALLADGDDELAVNIRRFLVDDACRLAVTGSRDRALARFSWPAVITAHLEEYGRAIQRAGATTTAASR